MQTQDIVQIERELARQQKRFAKSSAYEIFDLWEGCGRKNVQSRYYELVKIHHPDRYGGNTSSKLKKLTQSIFLQVQEAYQELSGKEMGPQTAEAPERVRAGRLEQLAKRQATSSQKRSSEREEESIQYKRMQRTGEFEKKTVGSVFEAVTISERDAATLEEDSLPEEERRAKLAALARTARGKTVRPPITQVIAQRHSAPETLEEDSALSLDERRDALAALSSRTKVVPPGAFKDRERTPTEPSLHVDSVPLADPASSGAIRGLSSSMARQQAKIPQHQQDFTTGVSEFREARYKNAFKYIDAAYQAEPANELYKTYYAYLLFMIDGEEKERADELLKSVIRSKDRLALPDAHLFLGYIIKAGGRRRDVKRAQAHFRKALELNPSNREAEREIRLYDMRQKDEPSLAQADVGAFFKRLFKK